MKKVILPLLVTFLFIFESIFISYSPKNFLDSDLIYVPRFLIIALILLSIYVERKYAIVYAFIFGFLYDVVFTEILGVHLFAFPFIVYIVSLIMKVLQSNIVISTFVSLFGVALLEFVIYGIYSIINITSMSVNEFIEWRLIPTLFLNFIFTVIFIYPLKVYFEKLKEAISNE